MTIQIAEGNLRTKYGEWKEILFYDGQKESIALIMGEVKVGEKTYYAACIPPVYLAITSAVLNVTAENKWKFRSK